MHCRNLKNSLYSARQKPSIPTCPCTCWFLCIWGGSYFELNGVTVFHYLELGTKSGPQRSWAQGQPSLRPAAAPSNISTFHS